MRPSTAAFHRKQTSEMRDRKPSNLKQSFDGKSTKSTSFQVNSVSINKFNNIRGLDQTISNLSNKISDPYMVPPHKKVFGNGFRVNSSCQNSPRDPFIVTGLSSSRDPDAKTSRQKSQFRSLDPKPISLHERNLSLNLIKKL